MGLLIRNCFIINFACFCLGGIESFSPRTHHHGTLTLVQQQQHQKHHHRHQKDNRYMGKPPYRSIVFPIKINESIFKLQDTNRNDELFSYDDDEDEISEETWRMIEEGQPNEWEIMKDILGINLFTYILAGLIALFFSCNMLFGPGWLGQKVGLPGTGTFTEISKSLPDSVDLSKDEFLLH